MVISVKQKTTFKEQPLHQNVQVTFHYDVYFTNGLFELENPLLAQVASAEAKTSPKTTIAVVDSGLLKHHPKLPQQLAAYTKHYD